MYALHADALMASLKIQAAVGTWTSQMDFCVRVLDACQTWVSRMVFAICWRVCSSHRCHGEELNERKRLQGHGCDR